MPMWLKAVVCKFGRRALLGSGKGLGGVVFEVSKSPLGVPLSWVPKTEVFLSWELREVMEIPAMPQASPACTSA